MLGVNTLYRLFCFFKLFPMVGKLIPNYIMVSLTVRVHMYIRTCMFIYIVNAHWRSC